MASEKKFCKYCFCTRTAKAMAVAFTAMGASVVHAEGGDLANVMAKARLQATLDFRIVIPTVLKVKSLISPRSLVIEQADIDRGYMEINDASSLAIVTNSRQGFMLSAQIDSTLLETAEVRLMNHTSNHTLRVEGDLSSMLVKLPGHSHDAVAISYRLYLSKQVRVGKYDWPVMLGFSSQTI
jgi:hypothetical protein